MKCQDCVFCDKEKGLCWHPDCSPSHPVSVAKETDIGKLILPDTGKPKPTVDVPEDWQNVNLKDECKIGCYEDFAALGRYEIAKSRLEQPLPDTNDFAELIKNQMDKNRIKECVTWFEHRYG